MSFTNLLWTSAQPIIKMLIIAAGGATLFKTGAINPAGLKVLSKVNIYLLAPPLLFVKIVAGITVNDLPKLGIIVLVALIYLLLGLLAGLLIRRCTRTTPTFNYAVIACATWGNWGDIPLAVILSLGALPPFSAGDDTKGVAYASIFVAVFYFTLWGAGYKLFQMDYAGDDKKLDLEMEVDLEGGSVGTVGDKTDEMPEEGMGDARESAPAAASVTAPSVRSTAMSTQRSSSKRNNTPTARRIVHRLGRVYHTYSSLFNVPNVTLLLSLVIALAPPLKSLFVRTDGGEPPLGFLFRTLDFLAGGTVPMSLVSLGGGLAQLSFRQTSLPSCLSLVTFKLLLQPVFGLGLSLLLTHTLQWVDMHDKIFRFVLLFMSCTPTASTTILLTQFYSPTGESVEIGSTLFVMYVASCVTMTGFIALFIHLVG
ncbi:auxin efflux carrier [Fimicolochytrium jonesii]|uniref:auxin efflux carrier n=1 Tax=Fimicolochytrium jonesii TaxID=1396493 RepID=UPI0022FF43B5|nr:auxin efflux carrier [Fimicolochytrium jonesii]KAI8821486.1 auxin efflux carrier [Fimicolochytrium jonesii]